MKKQIEEADWEEIHQRTNLEMAAPDMFKILSEILLEWRDEKMTEQDFVDSVVQKMDSIETVIKKALNI